MRLLYLGMGYCAQALSTLRRDPESAGTVRRPEKRGPSPEGLPGSRILLFDGGPPNDDLRQALAEAEALVVSIPPSTSGDTALTALETDIANAPHLRRIVYFSTVGVYGDWGGAWVDETSETRTRSARGLARVAAEAQWRDLGRRAGVGVDVMRLAGIYGPGRNALVKLLQGDAQRIVKPGQVFNRTHVADIARIASALLERDGPGEVWNVADEEPAPPQDVIAFAADLLGVPAPPKEDFEKSRLSEMAASFYADNRRVSIAKLKRELGLPLLFPTYREGLTALAAELGRESQTRSSSGPGIR